MVEHLQEIVKTSDYALRKKLLKKYPTTGLLRLGSSDKQLILGNPHRCQS